MPSGSLQFEDRDEYMVCNGRAMHIALRDHKKENQSQNKGDRWMDEECTYIDKHWVVHRVVELLYYTHKANVIVYNYTGKK